jgi:hypothetical protein
MEHLAQQLREGQDPDLSAAEIRALKAPARFSPYYEDDRMRVSGRGAREQ